MTDSVSARHTHWCLAWILGLDVDVYWQNDRLVETPCVCGGQYTNIESLPWSLLSAELRQLILDTVDFEDD